MKIAVPPQTPQFGLVDQGESTADERAVPFQDPEILVFSIWRGKYSDLFKNLNFGMRIWVLGTGTSRDPVPHFNGNVYFLGKTMTWLCSTT